MITPNTTLDEYQILAGASAIYPGSDTPGQLEGILYTALGLAEEAGEVAGKAKKLYRGDDLGKLPALLEEYASSCGGALLAGEACFSVARREAVLLELGDVLWYLAEASNQWGFKLSDVAEANMVKLTGRLANGTIQGDGDNR